MTHAAEANDMERVRAFFGPRARTWDERFPDDGPEFAAAVDALLLPSGGAALDVGCGTGRVLGSLRDAVAEANERFYVQFSAPTNATISGFAGLAPITVNNDD